MDDTFDITYKALFRRYYPNLMFYATRLVGRTHYLVAPAGAGTPVTAPLAGNIWKVLVNPGDVVEVGQPLIIVEAMKMELAINAPQSGRVKRIGCQPGRPVAPGDTLLWLE